MLWDYSWHKFNFRGYICPQMSLAWGVLLTGVMAFLFPFLLTGAQKIPRRVANGIALGLTVAVVIDWILCFMTV